MKVSLHAARLHYRPGFVLHTAASGAVPELSELYLRLDDGDVVGIGEVRINIAYLNGLAEETVIAAAHSAVAEIDWSADAAELLAGMPDWAARYAAPVRMLIDGALHDLLARRAGTPLAVWLGAETGAPVVSATNQSLFWSSFDSFLQTAELYVERGFHDLKVRVAAGPFEEDLRRIGALRARFGNTVKLAADANARWSEDEAVERLKALAAFDLAYVEQPIPPGDWSAVERVAAAASGVPIMLDEGVATPADVERVCGLGGRVLAHLKLVKLGGVAPAMAALRRLAESGVACMVGQMNEGAAATAAALHVACAASPAYAELYGADGLLDDPSAGLAYGRGTVGTGTAPGLGVVFDPLRARVLWTL